MNLEYRDPAASKNAGITYHLAIQSEWDAQRDSTSYNPGAYPVDGFIHCTNGLDLLTEIANMFYQQSPDERTILVLDLYGLESEVRYDDESQRFPHIYGPLNLTAVIGELPVGRGEDGAFTLPGFGS